MSKEEIERKIAELERAASQVPIKHAGKLLMRVAQLNREMGAV